MKFFHQTKPAYEALEEENERLRRQLAELTEEHAKLKGEHSLHEQNHEIEVAAMRCRLKEKQEELKDAQAQLQDVERRLRQSGMFLTFDSLREGGILANNVKDFTFFCTVDCNEKFLHAINFADGSPGSCDEGDGMCENHHRYTLYSIAQRKADQSRSSNSDETGGASDAASNNPAAESSNAAESASSNHHKEKKAGRQRKLDYKTEWLVYNLYIHSGWTEEQVAPLVGVGATTVHNIIYAWANYLNDVLSAWFPIPTRSQMLRAYPISILRIHGHCRIFSIMDATEQFTQDATRTKVHAAIFSAYKNHPTIKFLACCDGIGVCWADQLPDGYPGAISDPVSTFESKILDVVPFGTICQVDKGFLIDNDAILLGILTSRPQKMLKLQAQQSPADTVGTQKVAHSRIPIEQLNGGAKASARWLDGSTPITQIGLLSLIMRTCFLMQNFHVGFVQGRRESPSDGRPSRAEVRYYNATEDGLFDARPCPELWATNTEQKRFKELLALNPERSRIDIAEQVLQEDWPKKLREDLLNKLAEI